MSAEKRWPGGAVQRADRVGMESQAGAAFHPDFHPSQRQMQAARLAEDFGLHLQRAALIAAFAFGERE